MKNRMIFLIIAVIFCLVITPLFLQGQDSIFTTSKQVVLGKVTEIGKMYIIYRVRGGEDFPLVEIQKNLVFKIVFSNGEVLQFYPSEEIIDNKLATYAKKQAIKMDFISPYYNAIELGYERQVGFRKNIDVKIGIISDGITPGDGQDLNGGYAKLGMKMYSMRQYSDGRPISSPLDGGYLKFEFAFSHFSRVEKINSYQYQYGSYYRDATIDENDIGLSMIIGAQHIIGNVVTFDLFIGVGHGFAYQKISGDVETMRSASYSGRDASNKYAFFMVGDEIGMTFTTGLSFGYLF